MTSFPRHLSNFVPQNISLRCFNWSHIIRQMAMFTDCPFGFTTCKLAGGASNSWEAWWLAAYCWGIEDWDRLQMICPDVRMSFHGSIIALEWIPDDILFSIFNHCQNVAWYESMPSSLDFACRSQGPEVPSMLRLSAGQGGNLKSTCWWSWTGFSGVLWICQ